MKYLRGILFLLLLLAGTSRFAAAQAINPLCVLSNTQTTNQVLTATNNGKGCAWEPGGGGGAISLTAGTGISVSPNPITGTGVITNTAPGIPAGNVGSVQILTSGFINASAVSAGGTGYAVGDYFSIGPAGAPAAGMVSTISGGGGTGPVTGYIIALNGYGYTTGIKATVDLTGSGTGLTINVTSVSAAAFGNDPAVVDYLGTASGLGTGAVNYPTPAAPPVAAQAPTGSTAYSYYVTLDNGVGPTLSSAATSITNGSASPNNNITLPTVFIPGTATVDPNCTVWITRAAGPGSPIASQQNCDGSVINDSGAGNFDYLVTGVSPTNGTPGVHFNQISASSIRTQSVNFHPISGTNAWVNIQDANGNAVVSQATDSAGNWFDAAGATASTGGVAGANRGAANFWKNVTTVGNMGASSPYQMTYNVEGFIKCDTAAGNVTVHLPVASTLPFTPYGVMLTIHKPKAANSCIIDTSDGTTINGNASVTLTAAASTLEVYWDAVTGDGNTGMWASSYQYNPNFALTTNPLSQFASTTSAQLRGIISDESGSGAALFAGTGVANISGAAPTASPTFTGTVTQPSFNSTTNCSNAASPATCGSAPAGAVAIPTGTVSVTLQVNTTAVTANSEIFLQADDSLTIAATTCNSTLATLVGGMAVTARNPGVSFTVTFNGTIATNKLCASYHIVN